MAACQRLRPGSPDQGLPFCMYLYLSTILYNYHILRYHCLRFGLFPIGLEGV